MPADYHQEIERVCEVVVSISGNSYRKLARMRCSAWLMMLVVLSLVLVGHAMEPGEALCQDICARKGEGQPEECVFICQQIMSGEIEVPVMREQEGYLSDEFFPENNIDKRQKSAFVRIGRQKSSFVRIGKKNSYDDVLEKRPSSWRSKNFLKRPSSFVRIGRSTDDTEKRASSFVRIGKSLESMYDRAIRPSSFVRIGKSPSSFVRIGKKSFDVAQPDDESKRASSFVRIGKSSAGETEKRASSFVRIGKSSDMAEEEDKRASSFVRIGKKDNDKRASNFVRIGKSMEPTAEEADKRASSFVRIGKSSNEPHDMYVDLPENENSMKRASSFVRIGKNVNSLPDEDKRARSGFVRIGKAVRDSLRTGLDSNEEAYDKRASNFVRIGKR